MYPGTGGRAGMMLKSHEVGSQFGLRDPSKDGAHFMFLGMAFHSFGPQTAKE